MTRPIIIDSDPGIDDALAIMLAAASREVEILGIVAVAGNVALDQTCANAAALADLLHLDIPIGRGASGPLWREPKYASYIHGENGLGGYQLPPSARILQPGIPLLARLIEKSVEPVTVIAIGPLTNIAMLMNEYPETARKMKRLVIMGGGTLDQLGNTTPTAEFNIYFDPDAAVRVFGFGIPITMVGLNATHQAVVGMAHLPSLHASGGPIARMVCRVITEFQQRFYPNDVGMHQHDALAVAAALVPDVITAQHLRVDIENVGRFTEGMTVVDHRGRSGSVPNVDVALGVDVERFRTVFDSRLAELDRQLKEQS